MSIDHLRVIGCLCYATNTQNEDKFTERARGAVLIGYSKTQKGTQKLRKTLKNSKGLHLSGDCYTSMLCQQRCGLQRKHIYF